MYKERVLVSGAKQAELTMERIAWQLLESYSGQELPVFLGIGERGFSVAVMLANETGKLSGQSLQVYRLPGWRNQPDDLTYPKFDPESWRARKVLLVDDVLYTGKTMYYALQFVMQTDPAQVKSMVWVDRGHRCFPLAADFVGIQLATVLQDFVEVKISLTENQIETFLR